MWEVVGGAGENPGVLVRLGEEFRSPILPVLLGQGAAVEEIELRGDRLHYRLKDGEGPDEGWISVRFNGRDLVVQQKEPRPPPPTTVGPDDKPPLPVGLIFPGQGSQYVKMLDGVRELPAVKDMLEKAEKILGYDVLQLCQEGPEEKLEETRYCQPAMFITGLAAVEKLRQLEPENVTRASVMAGFSLGEYTALCAAGVLEFEDALKLVKLRGEAMHAAAEIGKQKMLSVVGLDERVLQSLCRDAVKRTGDTCQIAIYLFPKGFSIGGSEAAIQSLKVAAEKAGAVSAKIIKTSGAFHTPLMQPALDQLAVALEDALPNMKPPLHSVWMNASGEPMRPGCDPKDIVQELKRQLTKPVLWMTSMKEAIKEGVTDWYEVGPSKQLKAMMKRIDSEAWKSTYNCESGEKIRDPLPKAVGPNGEPPMPIGLVFPGQGSQYVKMLAGVKELPAVQDMLEKASPILGWDVLELCEEGTEDKLAETKYCQPAMFIAGLAALEQLKVLDAEAANRAAAVAGFSLGEYTALCAAGVMSFEDGLRLVKLRGAAMDAATQAGKQGMLSVVGLDRKKVTGLCGDAMKRAGGMCQIAISLFTDGFSVGGHENTLESLKTMAEKAGAMQAKLLKASGAFHTPLMDSAVETVMKALEEVEPRLKSPMHSVYMNVTAEPLRPGSDPKEIIGLLKRQLTETVLWDKSVQEMIADGVTEFWELGPSRQLKAMMKRIDQVVFKGMKNVESGEKAKPPPPRRVGPKDEPPLPIVLLFPGQGSQVTGMLDSVKDIPAVKDMLEKSNEILGFDVLEFCKQDAGPLSVLSQCMPVMFITGMAALEKLRADEGDDKVDRAAVMAGLSCGEYVALCAAGCWSFEDTLKIMKDRGQWMMECTLASPQAILSVIGLEEATLKKLCDQVATSNKSVCSISLKLFPQGFSIGGEAKAIEQLADLCMKEGAMQAKVLGDHAFHTTLIEPVAKKLEVLLEEMLPKMKPPRHTVWMNATAEPVRPGCDVKEIVDNLIKQMCSPVLWEAEMKAILKELDNPTIYELGPGKTLKGMMKRIDANANKNMENIEV